MFLFFYQRYPLRFDCFFDQVDGKWNEILGFKINVNACRAPCVRSGGVVFTITQATTEYYIAVLITNVGGAGDVVAVSIKGCNTGWQSMSRSWGQIWYTSNYQLYGQRLSFQVTTSDEKMSTSINVSDANWQVGQTFQGTQI